jgi:hypothetical protein
VFPELVTRMGDVEALIENLSEGCVIRALKWRLRWRWEHVYIVGGNERDRLPSRRPGSISSDWGIRGRHQWECYFSIQVMHVVIAEARMTPLLEVAHQHFKPVLMENLDLEIVSLHQYVRHVR